MTWLKFLKHLFNLYVYGLKFYKSVMIFDFEYIFLKLKQDDYLNRICFKLNLEAIKCHPFLFVSKIQIQRWVNLQKMEFVHFFETYYIFRHWFILKGTFWKRRIGILYNVFYFFEVFLYENMPLCNKKIRWSV